MVVLLLSNYDRLLKKAHLLRCAQSPRSNVSVNTPPLVDSSRASHLDLLNSLESGFFNSAINTHSIPSFKADERVYYHRPRRCKRIRTGTDSDPLRFFQRPRMTFIYIAIDSEWRPE